MYDTQVGRWHTVDSLSEKYEQYSPYVYVLNNPIRKYDVKGLYYWDAVLRGTYMILGGGLGIAGGAAAAATPTGVGQVFGAVAIPTGATSVGLGFAKIMVGLQPNDGHKADNIPGGISETLGMGIDYMSGNKAATARNAGQVVYGLVGLITGGLPKTQADVASFIGNNTYMGFDFYNAGKENQLQPMNDFAKAVQAVGQPKTDSETPKTNNGNLNNKVDKPTPFAPQTQKSLKPKVNFFDNTFGI
ncbi:RHS repeat-associated core domain-containing protein [Chitinophaga terrae (ex Kim and Jung 2007)]|uniref:RHS repeat-associated core domain-containing protein n=2 Tax=Chitinophaga terrae (ex Kim and Jung 2007) TaxID=408074 RepID=A0A1H4CF85_9BACT|nr:hypothetical protein CTE07_05850 [Chitinophaga terrae (ex Kim and Jung 2007)]SEA58983.1 RHS repeat-associated core domain-containing protein [Chitinophaga terrae (ex Kim and Jung 2007)]